MTTHGFVRSSGSFEQRRQSLAMALIALSSQRKPEREEWEERMVGKREEKQGRVAGGGESGKQTERGR